MSLNDAASDQPGLPSPKPELPELRQITDAQTMRALSHPVRIALIEVLSLEGPLTATEVGELIGESPTTCSFHLRQLAKYGFVEEAGGGKGRARPWRMTSIGQQISAHGDPEAELAAGALGRLIRERQLDRYRTWLETKAAYPLEWREAADDSEYVFYLTAEELKQLNRELLEMLRPRVLERLTDPSQRPPGSVPVEMLVFSYPIALPEPGSDDRPADRETE
jgi:DNA-binding transcriptional ArsR family regulator